MKNMNKFIIILFAILLGINSVHAYDLVLPKTKKSVVTTDYAFFVGNARKFETITVNGEKIYTASNGAFAHSVKLKDGENRILLRSSYRTSVYTFLKKQKEEQQEAVLNEFEPKLYVITDDNTPLRSTPIDLGLNRMAHLFADTKVLINGKKGDFYRVKLSKDAEGWVAADKVRPVIEKVEIPQFITMKSETFKNASVHTIEFTDKIPYTIQETDKEIIFKAYNPQLSEKSVYTVNIKKPKKYVYKTISSNGVYVFKVNSLPQPENKTLEGINIAIDAGHGGSENGAIGCLGDKEKDINLAIANELKDILTQMGACVVMTRECDANVSLDERVKIARDNCANIFVSIHMDSIPDIKMDIHKNRGTTAYYFNPNSKDLAKSVSESVSSNLKTKNNGIKTASFAVVRPSDYIGILVENAYMTNPLDSVLYRSDSFPRNAAVGIANGILNYVNSDK